MKKLAWIFILLLTANCNLFAQSEQAKIGCKDPNILVQATALKQGLIKQGFEVLNDAMLTMESRQDFPVVVRLQGGVFYQILFVGNTRAKKMSLNLFEKDEQALISKEQEPLYQTSNVIAFSFTPSTDGDFTFILSQTLKQQILKPKESSCGSFSILRLKKTEK